MFTISCYTFHPLIQRFVRLWRYVQLVSDILTCILSMICCQCVDAMPLSTSTSVESKTSIEALKLQENKPEAQLVDPGKSSGEPLRAQHLVIDFTPGREDTPEIQAKCQQFWQFTKNKPELGGMMVQPSQDSDRRLTELSSSVIHQVPYSDRNRTNLPAIHTIRKMDKRGAVKAAFNTGEVSKYYT
ncbi:uncharacterized protein LOC113492228 [Trichoplusia ni]|uniref:Uncharacterized protein LOC113492228 n=1 Tax=Trichoplusia ni TaxID=7111 RepID=A0A7E5VAV0_TRINI|nr:uncharacterized protein LOC113492228 [Trichoplusia ni]